MAKRPILVAIAAVVLATGTASAQLLGGGGPLGGGPVGGVSQTLGGTIGGLRNNADGAVNSLGGGLQGLNTPLGSLGGLGNGIEQGALGALGDLGNLSRSRLSEADLNRLVSPSMILHEVNPPQIGPSDADLLARIRKIRHELLIRQNKNILERDSEGQPVRRNELVVVDPDPVSLSAAIRAGFRLTGDERQAELGMRIITLASPKGVNARDGLKLLRKTSPALQADYNHIFEPAGGSLLPATAAALAAAPPARPGTRIAMIDGGVASHPSLAGAAIEQRGFSGPAEPTGHGTAVGSLLVGDQGPFRGAARGAQLFVGDVYGGNPAAGSATSIVRALAWAASKRPAVINISLIGPDNRALARAIGALRARGIQLVAAVGNDGPAAPPQYPASYPGVIAVTGVDSADRALYEAGRATHLDFAGPGADLVAALPGKGYSPVRGTSFAAPFIAARLAAAGSPASLSSEAVPGKGKVGRGIVCRHCRVAPKMVGLK